MRNKRKVISLLLAAAMFVTMSGVGQLTVRAEDGDTSGGNIESETEETVEQNTSEVSGSESVPDLGNEADAEVIPEEVQTAAGAQGENPSSDEVITGMDENGNIYEVEADDTLVPDDDSLRLRAAVPRIVNFRTGAGGNTEYTEAGTGIPGYTNGAYGADAAYLGIEGGKVKFMISGVIGLVDPAKVQVLALTSVQSSSCYTVSNGRLIHKVSTNVGTGGYASSLDNGPAPSYLSNGATYYSYDGHYFYTHANFGNMLDDYNNGNRNRSVNASAPFYNYFQYLPLRSTTNYSGASLNSIVNARVQAGSKMANLGDTFVSMQNQYGTNALLMAGVAANESAWGMSNISQTKNNLFGLNAVDSSPNESANYYPNVAASVKDFSETYMSKQYLNPSNWKYYGGFLGNKASGANVKYASDPYWGEKAAGVAWSLSSGGSDVNKYTLGIKDKLSNLHNNVNVRNSNSASSVLVYQTGNQSNQSFIILDKAAGNGFYKIQSDPVLNAGRTGIAGDGNYNFNNMYVYISSSYVTPVIEGTGIGGGQTVPPISVPGGYEQKLSVEAHVTDIGWQSAVNNGVMSGTMGQIKSMQAMKVKVKADGIGIKYRAHVSNKGWMSYAADGAVAGTTGQNLPMEAVQFELTGANANQYKLYYRTHVSDMGWLGWASSGEQAGSEGYGKSIEAMQVVLLPANSPAPGSTDNRFTKKDGSIQYYAHVSEQGWQGMKNGGEIAGTIGQVLSMQAIKIGINGISGLGVNYSAHVQDKGWLGAVANGAVGGTVGANLPMEALKISLTGANASKYDIYYRTHISNMGWLGWAKNGEEAGSQGYAYAMEAIQIVLQTKGSAAPGSTNNHFVKKAVNTTATAVYSAHVRNIGWQGAVQNGQTAGTTGRVLSVEAMKISISGVTNLGVTYKAHVRDVGWQPNVSNNAVAGTTGKALSVEAMQISLNGTKASQYDIYYRMHVSELGWLDWAKNGASAGSQGYALPVEAVQIKVQAKGSAAPGATKTPFKKK